MRVLQVHYIDKANDRYGGGGAIAMYRLHGGLRTAGVNSRILCRLNTLGSSESIALPHLPRLESHLKTFTSRLGLNDIHCLSTFLLKQNKDYEDTDILHLHCIHGGFFNYLALPRLTEAKPAVFAVHDMWPFTGHCGYSWGCERWQTGCGKCPYPDTYPPIKRDGTRLEWRLKDWVYSRSNIVIVNPSKWMTEQAKKSMLSRFPIHEIPNGVDTQTYQPHDPDQCRSQLGIPPAQKVLLFAAPSIRDRRKGGDLLMKALQRLPESLKAETLLLTIGHGSDPLGECVGMRTRNLGYIGNDHLKAIAYSAADLFVLPTRADNCPLVLLESMACGTPMVSFRTGGVPDLVRPGITGYLAEPENEKDLCEGILQLLEDEPLRKVMSQQCRAIAVNEYSIDLHVERHIELYRQILDNGAA